jgi:hypothetical protein
MSFEGSAPVLRFMPEQQDAAELSQLGNIVVEKHHPTCQSHPVISFFGTE